MPEQSDDFNGLRLRRGGLITAKWGNRLIDLVRRATVTSVVNGSFEQGVAHGTIIRVNPAAGGAPDPPFWVIATSDGSGGYNFTVEPGTYNAEYPTLDGDPLDIAGTGVLGTGARYVYLKLTYTYNTTASGYVASATLDSAEITSETAEQTNATGPSASGVFWVLLASFDDGKKTGQPVRTSLSGEVCDFAGTGISFSANAGTDVITATGHTYSNGDAVAIQVDGTAPGGLSMAATYYVRDVSGSTFKLAATAGGSAIDITSAGSGTLSIHATALATLTVVES